MNLSKKKKGEENSGWGWEVENLQKHTQKSTIRGKIIIHWEKEAENALYSSVCCRYPNKTNPEEWVVWVVKIYKNENSAGPWLENEITEFTFRQSSSLLVCH